MSEFEKWLDSTDYWVEPPCHGDFDNCKADKYVAKAFKEARKGYVKLEDVLRLLEDKPTNELYFCTGYYGRMLLPEKTIEEIKKLGGE